MNRNLLAGDLKRLMLTEDAAQHDVALAEIGLAEVGDDQQRILAKVSQQGLCAKKCTAASHTGLPAARTLALHGFQAYAHVGNSVCQAWLL